MIIIGYIWCEEFYYRRIENGVSSMLSRVFFYIYDQPLDKVMRFSVVIIIEWAILMYLMREDRKRLKAMNQGCAAATLLAVLAVTVLNREIGSCSEVILQPFSSFSAERFSVEMCREFLMNVFLFLPLGIFMPFALPEHTKNKALVTVLLGMCVSMGAETLQYLFQMGWCEADDVISNTLGVALGSRSYVLFEKLPRLLHTVQDVIRNMKKKFLLEEKIESENQVSDRF